MKIIDRIYEYIEYKKISVARFERENVLSTGYLAKMKARSADIGETMLNNIIENSPDISLQWLILGEGPMLKNAEKETTGSADERPSVPDMAYFDRLVEKICELSAEVRQLRQENEHLRTIHLDTHTQPPAAAV